MKKQTIPALNVANYFIQASSQDDEPDLTNLKLQKLLYFAQGQYLAKFNKPLFEDDIEAWEYGPVVKSVYHQFKHCGAFPITAFDIDSEVNISDEKTLFLKKVWSKYAKYSAEHLVDITHKKGSPWEKNYKNGLNNIIPQNELRHYFLVKTA
ncbi:DUF4065 domain-containing protein [Patescibacteria group bacterium]|nr:DUF4065 domain-containing protein [Patescibacteria group bacterium]MBU1885646.1 DUF4065 domain-containing protein [Patescibacteria group bacterium]